MPEEQERFQDAIDRMLEAVMFENWLRFYFLSEDGLEEGQEEATLRIAIPDKAMDRIRELYGPLASMAELLNAKEATLESSRNAVCDYINSELEGKIIPRGGAVGYFDTRAFQVSLQLFNVWVQAYESVLDQQFLDFGRWRDQFAAWRRTEHARQIEDEMDRGMRAQN